MFYFYPYYETALMGTIQEKKSKNKRRREKNAMDTKYNFNEKEQELQSYREKAEDIRQDFLQACEKFKSGPLLIEELQRRNIWLSLESTNEDQRSQSIKLFPLNKDELRQASEADCKNWKLPQLLLSRFYTQGETAKLQESAYEKSFGIKLDPTKNKLSQKEKDIQRVNVYISPDFLPLFLRPDEFLNDLKKLIEIEKEKTAKYKSTMKEENEVLPVLLPVLNRVLQQKEELSKTEQQQHISSGIEAAFKEKWSKEMQVFGITERGNKLLLFPPLSEELLATYKSVFVSTSSASNQQQGNSQSQDTTSSTSIQSLTHLFRPVPTKEEGEKNPFVIQPPMVIHENIELYVQERQRVFYEQQLEMEKQKREETKKTQEKAHEQKRPQMRKT